MHNEDAKRFIWHKTDDEILESMKRYYEDISETEL